MACSADDASKSDDIDPDAPEHIQLETSLAGSEWTPGESTGAFIAFKADGKIIGNGGCNAFNGSYEQDGTSLKIGPLAATKKMCSPDVMGLENKLYEALDKTRFFAATHMNLALDDADGQPLMIFQRTDWD